MMATDRFGLTDQQCDEERPGCSRCKNAGHVCPGYRNLEELVFRDENARIVKRSRKRRPRASTTTPDDDAGLDFFFSIFQFPEPPPFGRQNEWLNELITGDRSIPLENGLRAVGLAALANVESSISMAERARRLRDEVSIAVEDALQDHERDSSDSVLMGLLLLILYEVRYAIREVVTMLTRKNITLRSWTDFNQRSRFIDPAVGILRRRGPSQFARPVSTLLYVQIRHEAVRQT